MHMTGQEDSKFDINEYEVVEGAPKSSFHPDDIHRNLNDPTVNEVERDNMIPFEDLSRREQRRLRKKYRRAQKRGLHYDKKGEPKYGWSFFLASLFIGLGITATIDAPLPLFLGLAVGFLFFVDPIYEKAME
ncbi:MAG: hypothetical protein AAF655_27300, partial [Bacteroidota bacterium]